MREPVTPAQVSLIEDMEELLHIEFDWSTATKASASEFISKYKKRFDSKVFAIRQGLHHCVYDDSDEGYLEYSEV